MKSIKAGFVAFMIAALLSVLWWSSAVVAILATVVYIRNGSRYIEHFERSQAKKPGAVPGNTNERQHH